jgi:NitT/TauT family transport system permease protein
MDSSGGRWKGGTVVSWRRVREEIVPPAVGLGGVIALWAVVAATTTTDAIPGPGAVWTAFLDGISDGSLVSATVRTLIRLVFSFGVAVVFGVVLGLALTLNAFARRSIRPLVVALQITPFVAWVPLAVIWFGTTERAVVFVAIVGAFPSMTLATIQGIRQVPPLYERAGRTLGATGWTLYRRVVFPSALPGVMAGLQQAWGFAWKALMAGELIVTAAGSVGLGHLLNERSSDVSEMLAVLGVIVVVGVAAEYLIFGQLDRRIRARRGLLVEG